MSNFWIMAWTGINPERIPVEFITFSDGCETVKLPESTPFDRCRIVCNVENGTRDTMRILLVNDALRRLNIGLQVSLWLNYVPYARADRVFEGGNPLPLKVFADLINSCKFEQVDIQDPHSDVTTALINNCLHWQQFCGVGSMTNDIKASLGDEFKVVSPDAGALKKIYDVAAVLNVGIIEAGKKRDISTGKIVGCTVHSTDLEGSNLLIVDDICDGGASFTHLADALREHNCGKIGLYVTHGIFAKGLDVFKGKIDYIFCKNIIGNYITRDNIDNFNRGEQQ